MKPLAELLYRTIYFLAFYKAKFGIFGEYFALATLGVKGLNNLLSPPHLSLLSCAELKFFIDIYHI